MREIPLSRGLFAIVDDADYDVVSALKWFAMPASNNSGIFYAARNRPGGGQIRLHNVLMAPPPGLVVDHINRNGLDNRRANLRLATARENMANRRFPVGVSGYRGVYRVRSRWSANISRGGQSITIGTFADAESAARAYDAAALAEYGEFAVLNFPAANDADAPPMERVS